MILGLGIDSVLINRFDSWHLKPHLSLMRIFSYAEIEYCLSNPAKSAERFAARFAAREALYKALSTYCQPIPFLTLCRLTSIMSDPAGKPSFSIDSELAAKLFKEKQVKIWLSFSHTQITATAIVIIESCCNSSNHLGTP